MICFVAISCSGLGFASQTIQKTNDDGNDIQFEAITSSDNAELRQKKIQKNQLLEEQQSDADEYESKFYTDKLTTDEGKQYKKDLISINSRIFTLGLVSSETDNDLNTEFINRIEGFISDYDMLMHDYSGADGDTEMKDDAIYHDAAAKKAKLIDLEARYKAGRSTYQEANKELDHINAGK